MQLVKRKTREFVRDQLIELGTLAKDRVAIGKVAPTWIEDLPAILIFPISEAVRRFDEAPKRYQREFSLSIECLAKGDDGDQLDEILEVMAETVENFIELDETLGGLVDRVELRSSEYEYEEQAQSPTGSLILNYAVRYYWNANQPGIQCLDDLKGIDIDYKVGHHDASPEPEPIETVDAEDKVDFNE